MWKVVYVASSPRLANRLQKILMHHGMLITLRAVKSTEDGPMELLAPNSEAEDALEIINHSLLRWGRVTR